MLTNKMDAIKHLEGQKQMKRVKKAYRDLRAAEKAKGRRTDAAALDQMMKSLRQDLSAPQPPAGLGPKRRSALRKAQSEVLNQIEEVNEEESSANSADEEGSGSGGNNHGKQDGDGGVQDTGAGRAHSAQEEDLELQNRGLEEFVKAFAAG